MHGNKEQIAVPLTAGTGIQGFADKGEFVSAANGVRVTTRMHAYHGYRQ